MRISGLKGYDDYGYELVNFSLPTKEEIITASVLNFSNTLSEFGLSAYDAADAIHSVAEILNRLQWAEDEITAIKDSLHDLRQTNEHQHSAMDCRMTALEIRQDSLRSAMDAKTESPKQKSDVEIFSQIIPNDDFLNFGDGNMFLN